MLDVAIVGAGLAGLSSGQILQQNGYRVMVLEKSRGVGGRAATRRLADTAADHGLRWLEPQGELTQNLIHTLTQTAQLTPWSAPIYQIDGQGKIYPAINATPRYAAPAGMNCLGKHLAHGLTIQRQQRVEAIAPQSDQSWQLTLVSTGDHPTQSVVQARAVILAIPAPQILPLVEPLALQGLESGFLQALQQVNYAPCITAIATYPAQLVEVAAPLPQGGAIAWPSDSAVAWLTLEQTKRPAPGPVLVVQSSPAFAAARFDDPDLQATGEALLAIAAADLAPWIAQPDTLQVHRWRYAIPQQPLERNSLTCQTFLSLLCGGDWCSTGNVEGALQSGQAIAQRICQYLGHP